MNADCRHRDDVNAFVARELPPPAHAEFESHLETCAACMEAVNSTRRLVSRLRALPQAESPHGLAQSLLEQARAERSENAASARWSRITAMAAAIALFAGGVTFLSLPRAPHDGPLPAADEKAASISRALDWFARHQEADGSWDAEKWGGNRRFQVALAALPLIALLDGEPTPERTAAANRAIAFVQRQQNADGTFGEDFREAPYIQSVSTLALLRAYQRQPAPELHRAIDSALRVILSTQGSDGAWGYHLSHAPNLPITLWHKHVVELASALGWHQAGSSLERVQAWLSEQSIDSTAEAGSDTMTGTDYHRAYFAVASLRQQQTPAARERIAAIRQSLITAQSETGDESGTWSPTDQWSRAGGRIYSTALASLTLR